VRPWLVIPATAIVALAGSFALDRGATSALGAAAAAAAITHAVRMSSSDTPPHLVGAALAALLAVASVSGAVACFALAAAAWTVAELARASTPPVVVIAPAVVAAILEPACVALVAIAGTRFVTRTGPRWTILPVLAGVLAALLAILAGTAGEGVFAALGARWYGQPAAAIAPARSLALLGDALGPLVAVAALGGLALLVRAIGAASLAVLACVAGALLVDLRAGAPGPMTSGLAALCAGLAVGRFAGTIRIASGQAIVATTCAALLLAPAAWIAVAASR
jgi:hypothetical protein